MRYARNGAIALFLSFCVASSLWASPEAEIYDVHLDWTTVPIGVTGYVATFVDNLGDQDLTLSNASITGSDAPDFSLIELPETVRPRAVDYPASGKRILIGFTPSSSGAKRATLSFNTNDPLLSSCTIDLFGAGIEPPAPQDMAMATWAYRYKTQPSLSVGDVVSQVHQAPDGGIFLVGVEEQCSSPPCEGYTYRRAVISKVDSVGSALWLKQYVGPHGSGEVLASGRTSDGGLIMILHDCLAEPGKRDLLLTKLAGSGSVEWVKRLGTSESIWVYALKQSSDGGFVIGGAIGDLQCSASCVSRALLIKTDPSGNVVIQKSFSGISVITDVSEGPGGDYLVSGPNEGKLALMKLSPDFNRIWHKSFVDVEAWSAWPETLLALEPDGRYLVVHRNTLLSFNSDDSLIYHGATDACSTYANTLVRDPSGGYLIGCAGGVGGRLIKFGTDGNVEWAREYMSYPAGIIPLEKGLYQIGFQFDGFAAARVGPKGRIDNTRYLYFSTELPGVTLAQTFDPASTPADFPSQDENLMTTDGRVSELGGTPVVTILAGLAVLPTYPVTVTVLGNGPGSVFSLPAGIECGSVCSDRFAAGTSVLLSAVPAPGLVVQWGGACRGSSTSCLLPDIQGPQSVTVAFKKAYPLTLANPGRGSGKVAGTVVGERIDCTLAAGQSCSYTVVENSLVVLAASPDDGNAFLGWSGACTGTDICRLTMTEAKEVQARFEPGVPLFVAKTGEGSGTVLSQPPGIDCGTTCSNGFVPDSTITLSARAEPGSVFSGWSGPCAGTGTCIMVAGSDAEVGARFDRLPPVTGKRLTVVKQGSGRGEVVSLHPKSVIECGDVCAADLPVGTRVMLHAHHEPDSHFVGWAGACSGRSTCKLRLDEDKTVMAIFKKKSAPGRRTR